MLLVVSLSGRFFGSLVWRSQFCPLAVRHVPLKFWAEHFWFIDHGVWVFFNLLLTGVSGNGTDGRTEVPPPRLSRELILVVRRVRRRSMGSRRGVPNLCQTFSHFKTKKACPVKVISKVKTQLFRVLGPGAD